MTTLVTSDQASTNGVEADETDQEAAHEVDDDEADRTRAIDDVDEAILEAALDRKFFFLNDLLHFFTSSSVNQMAPRSAQRKKRMFFKFFLKILKRHRNLFKSLIIFLAALEADQPEETAVADLVLPLVIDAHDRALLARIALDPDLPDALDLAPVPDKVLLPKETL